MVSRTLFIIFIGFTPGLTSVSAHAQSVPCSRIRQCSSALQVYELAAAGCRAQMKSFECSAYKSDPNFKNLIRNCTPEAMCEEKRDWDSASGFLPGCTGITAAKAAEISANVGACWRSSDCMKQVPMETLRVIGRSAIGIAYGAWEKAKTVYNLAFNYRETSADVKRGALEYNRRFQCLNNQYKYHVACEIAGGTFAAASVGGAAAKVKLIPRAAAGGALDRLATRSSVVAAREVAGRGVRPAVIRRTRGTVAAAGAAGAAAAKPAPARPAVSPIAVAEANRDQYIRRLVGNQTTTLEQRRAFADLAYKTKSDGHTVFLDLQNSKMKYLNDHLSNKNVVTAVTNHRLELTFRELESLKAKYPQMETLVYDDFKSGRLAFKFADGKVPTGFMNDVSGIMSTAETDYIAELGRLKIIPEGSEIMPADKWFASGTGRTGDEANVASRYASRTDQPNVDFWSPVVRRNLEARLAQTETQRAGLMRSLRETPMTEKLPSGEYVPSLDAFEAYRKSHDTKEFAKLVSEKTGQSISAQQAQSMTNYLSMLDEWSTGLLLVEPRQAVSFVGSKFNGVTIDVSGMGALNMSKLSKALVGERDIQKALTLAREAEQAATVTFERNKAAIVDSARASLREQGIEAEVRVSGDDIIILPTNRAISAEALDGLHRAVAASPSSSNVRISAVSTGVARADEIAVLGETIEKRVRGLAQTTVTDPSKYTLMVVSNAVGKPRLRVAARAGDVSPDVERAFQDAFSKAVTP